MRYVRNSEEDTDWGLEDEITGDDNPNDPTRGSGTDPTARVVPKKKRREASPMSRGITRRMKTIDSAILRMARGEEASLIPPPPQSIPVNLPPPLPVAVAAPLPTPLPFPLANIEPNASPSARVTFYSLVPREPEPFTMHPPRLFSFVPPGR